MNLRSTSLVVSGLLLLLPPTAPAQGTIYVSNLGAASAGSLAVGSDSWRAGWFRAGTNSDGYTLNSVQLALTGASGTPAGFRVMIYDSHFIVLLPRTNIANLAGSLDPVSSGVYTYTASSSVTLLPNMGYFIVITSDNSVSSGSFNWSYGNTPTVLRSDGWGIGAGAFYSNNGLSWMGSGNYLQFAVNATVIPEPSSWALAGVGALLFAASYRRGQL